MTSFSGCVAHSPGLNQGLICQLLIGCMRLSICNWKSCSNGGLVLVIVAMALASNVMLIVLLTACSTTCSWLLVLLVVHTTITVNSGISYGYYLGRRLSYLFTSLYILEIFSTNNIIVVATCSVLLYSGEVMLDKHKNSGIRTVVNKSGIIEETYRFFKMEVLAGEDKMETTILSNGCSFSFDFSKVYWNSRLDKEHCRIVQLLKRSDVVLDMFAGVGPFAIPACKIGCAVYANDLNPHSYSALCNNAKLNKVETYLKAYNLDAREFITKVTSELIGDLVTLPAASSEARPCPAAPRLISHVIMNLPASAVEFLDSFQGLMSDVPQHLREVLELPYVHCYHFTKSESPETDSLSEVERHLGVQLTAGSYTITRVRDVSPNKLMMRVSFKLPSTIAYNSRSDHQKSPGMLWCCRGTVNQ